MCWWSPLHDQLQHNTAFCSPLSVSQVCQRSLCGHILPDRVTQLTDTVGTTGYSAQGIDAPCFQLPVPWRWEGLKRDSFVPIPSGVGLVVPSLLAACRSPEDRPDTVNTVHICSTRTPVVHSPVLINTACQTFSGVGVPTRGVTPHDYIVDVCGLSVQAAGVRCPYNQFPWIGEGPTRPSACPLRFPLISPFGSLKSPILAFGDQHGALPGVSLSRAGP